MAKAVTKKTKVNIKAKEPTVGRMKCNVCGGTGYQKKPSHKKK